MCERVLSPRHVRVHFILAGHILGAIDGVALLFPSFERKCQFLLVGLRLGRSTVFSVPGFSAISEKMAPDLVEKAKAKKTKICVFRDLSNACRNQTQQELAGTARCVNS